MAPRLLVVVAGLLLPGWGADRLRLEAAEARHCRWAVRQGGAVARQLAVAVVVLRQEAALGLRLVVGARQGLAVQRLAEGEPG